MVSASVLVQREVTSSDEADSCDQECKGGVESMRYFAVTVCVSTPPAAMVLELEPDTSEPAARHTFVAVDPLPVIRPGVIR